jgi:aspartate aminotransferase
VQSQEAGCPSSVSQYALIAALEGPQDCVAAMRREYEARRELVCRRLSAIPGVKLHRPDGAFYAFFDVSAHFGRKPVRDSAGFCAAALETAHVNLVPGSAFGAEGYVRMSYAAGRDQLEGGLRRLEQWLSAAGN